MKGLKALTATLCAAVALSANLAPASANAAAYRHYVACGVTENAKPSHFCQQARDKGAFFESKDASVFYTVCVHFPNKKAPLCAKNQEAVQGELYLNKITSNIAGKHVVSWYVEGKKIGSFVFRVPS